MAGRPLKPGSTPDPSGAPITPVDTALYTIDMLESLRRMADRQGYGILAHLLELAQAEARMLARAPKN